MNTMNVTPEQVRAAAKANLEAVIEFANTQFAAAEKIGNLQAVAVKSAFEDALANFRALTAAGDMQEYLKLQASFAQPAFEKAIAYSKGVYEVMGQTHAEMQKLTERRIAEWNESLVSLVDTTLKNVPASDVAVNALKQAIAAGNSAFENMTRVTKQATEIAEANVAAATESVKGFVAKSRKAA
jgi:phasin family protein